MDFFALVYLSADRAGDILLHVFYFFAYSDDNYIIIYLNVLIP